MIRFALGLMVLASGAVVLGVLDVETWTFPLPMLGFAPFLLAGGALMGLHDPPPRRRSRLGQ
ncbi:MAG TPA: hypothetical protein VGW10_13085 [Solirubrobacteraceae bacterium]|nr:hypothetical protein [Solirubrobacteraceae bacterium]